VDGAISKLKQNYGHTFIIDTMATIRYAVIVSDSAAVPSNQRVEHLYQHRADATECVKVYQRLAGRQACVVELVPALAVVRESDTWVLYQGGPDALTFGSREAADAEAATDSALKTLATPIRQAMPVQHGVPQLRRN
jgi:hypothetical protein